MQKININGVDIEINVPTAEEMTLLKGQLEAAKKVISDLKKVNTKLTQGIYKANQEIQELRTKHDHLQKDMEGTVAAYEGMRETAKENQAACQVLRDKLDSTRAHLDAANDASKYWYNQYNVVNDKLQEIKKVLK